MTIYIVEHRRQSDLIVNHIFQEGFKTIEDAQRFIESRSNRLVKESEIRYYNSIAKEGYLIHDITIK